MESSSNWEFSEELENRRTKLNVADCKAYCLFCMSGSEIKLAKELNRKYNDYLALPFLRLMHKSRSGGKSLEQDVLLKGYVFLYAHESTDISDLIAGETAFRLLERGEDMRGELTGEDRKYAQWVFDQGGILGVSKAVRIGDKVKITAGPLLSMEGCIKEYSKKNRNCRVTIEMMGQQLNVWLPFEWTEASDTIGKYSNNLSAKTELIMSNYADTQKR